jgi:hypothetical protein
MVMTAVLIVMTGCATAGSSVKLHDPEVTQSLEEFMRGGFAAMDQGDMNYWKNSACPKGVMWDVDPEGKPMSARGKAEIDAALDGFQKMMASGTKLSSAITSIECRQLLGERALRHRVRPDHDRGRRKDHGPVQVPRHRHRREARQRQVDLVALACLDA